VSKEEEGSLDEDVPADDRYVNNLDEEQFKEREVQNTLKMLRTNVS
jgi:hypothetical protein